MNQSHVAIQKATAVIDLIQLADPRSYFAVSLKGLLDDHLEGRCGARKLDQSVDATLQLWARDAQKRVICRSLQVPAAANGPTVFEG